MLRILWSPGICKTVCQMCTLDLSETIVSIDMGTRVPISVLRQQYKMRDGGNPTNRHLILLASLKQAVAHNLWLTVKITQYHMRVSRLSRYNTSYTKLDPRGKLYPLFEGNPPSFWRNSSNIHPKYATMFCNYWTFF